MKIPNRSGSVLGGNQQQRFCEVVKHQRRYFFRDDDKHDSKILSPEDLLETIIDYAEKIDLIVRVDRGALKVIRARIQRDGQKFESAHDLGPLPQAKAIQSNRMSPAGVVMFYGSEQLETALRETARSLGAGIYAVGEFSNRREIVLLDLAKLPEIPSLFHEIPDSMEYNPGPVLQFLHHVSWEISQPVNPRDSSNNSSPARTSAGARWIPAASRP